MKDKPFRLQRVWQVAQIRVRSQWDQWSRWASRARQAREQAETLKQVFQASVQGLSGVGQGCRSAGELVARWRQVEDVQRRWRWADDRAAVLEMEAARRMAALLEARREEQAYQRLHRRHRDHWRREWQRLEQAQLDEMATARHGRSRSHAGQPADRNGEGRCEVWP